VGIDHSYCVAGMLKARTRVPGFVRLVLVPLRGADLLVLACHVASLQEQMLWKLVKLEEHCSLSLTWSKLEIHILPVVWPARLRPPVGLNIAVDGPQCGLPLNGHLDRLYCCEKG